MEIFNELFEIMMVFGICNVKVVLLFLFYLFLDDCIVVLRNVWLK